MGITSKSSTIVSAAMGLALFSQAPEFANHYQQRIGGAIDELRQVVEDFDQDADRSGMSRNKAVEQMIESQEKFPKDRGMSMQRTFTRFDSLTNQKLKMDRAHPVTRPLFILANPDLKVIDGAWEDYRPALPLTLAGVAYGVVGLLCFAIIVRLVIGGWRRVRRRRNDEALGA